MTTFIPLDNFRAWLLRYADRIDECADYLTELDAAIGDADHGLNMQRGLVKVRSRLLDEPEQEESSGLSMLGGGRLSVTSDTGALLHSVAMTLINSVGGAAGPLYGSFFLRFSKAYSGEVQLAEFAVMFRNGVEGVRQRGKARLNDKTMLDALLPAANALDAAAEAQDTLEAALEAMLEAARVGMENTVALEARKGRASYLGPRSVGHKDPGAASAFYLVETAAETLGRNR